MTWSPTSKTDPVTWALNGHTYSFTDQIAACPAKPVPVVADAALGGIASAGILGVVLFSRRRRRGWRPRTVAVA